MEPGFRLHYRDKTVYVTKSTLTGVRNGSTTVYETDIEGAHITWTFEPYRGGMLITLNARSDRPLGILRIDSLVISVGTPQVTDRIAFLGRSMYANETRYPCELGEGQEYGENCVGKFRHLADKGILMAGVAPFRNTYASVAYKQADGSFEFYAKTDFTQSESQGFMLCAERVYWHEAATIDDFLRDYRELLPQSSFPMPKLRGWNTWDYYLDRVTPEDIAENVTALKSMPFAGALDYIVIDDGWQRGWGDWRENEKFSCGLATVAESIRDAGFSPGIWMAPVGIKSDVPVFSEHPEWLCRDEEGEMLYDMGLYYLDPTHPDAEHFILDRYRYQYAAGYRLFKMDYVSPLLKVKSFYDKTATSYAVLARLVQRVKECTGPDAVVLGCSLPLECGADVAPSMRIAVDIHNYFSHVIWIAQSLAWSWMYNNKTTRIDPDFMVVRGMETCDEPLRENKRNDFVPPPRHLQTDRDRFKNRWRHGDPFNALEAETWANLVAISGGNIFLSDRMAALNERGISIIQNALELAGDEVRPCYQKEDTRLASLWKGERALLLINWEDVPRQITVDGMTHAISSHKPYTLENGALTVSLLPHESFAAVYL